MSGARTRHNRLARYESPHPTQGSRASRLLTICAGPTEAQALATLMFPSGSYGNGSAMRVGPIGCLYHQDPSALFQACRVSSRTTHSHPLAVQGATLQASAIAALIRTNSLEIDSYLQTLDLVLRRLAREGPEPVEYRQALEAIAAGLDAGHEPARMAERLGTGLDAKEAVPIARYCFLSSPDSFEESSIRRCFWAVTPIPSPAWRGV